MLNQLICVAKRASRWSSLGIDVAGRAVAYMVADGLGAAFKLIGTYDEPFDAGSATTSGT